MPLFASRERLYDAAGKPFEMPAVDSTEPANSPGPSAWASSSASPGEPGTASDLTEPIPSKTPPLTVPSVETLASRAQGAAATQSAAERASPAQLPTPTQPQGDTDGRVLAGDDVEMKAGTGGSGEGAFQSGQEERSPTPGMAGMRPVEQGLSASLSALPKTGFTLLEAAPAPELSRPPVFDSHTDASVLRQVSDGLRLGTDGGTRLMRIRLDPTDLGQVEIKIEVEGDKAKLVFVTERAEVGVLLSQQLDTLRAELLAQGLHLEEAEVQTADSQTRDGSKPSDGSEDGTQSEGGDSMEAIDSDPEPSTPTRADALIDVRA